MRLNYIYHSGFVIEGNDFSIIIDYYKDSGATFDSGIVHERILNHPGKLYVLSSHSHPDHFNPAILKWKEKHPDIQYIFSSDILDEKKTKLSDAVYLKKSEFYKDNILTIKAFGSTDIGISFAIEVEGKKIFHAGDLNNWHWNEESSSEYAKEAEDFYLKELDDLYQQEKYFDAVMFPIDKRLGKDYMKGAEQFLDKIKVGLFLPMHFDENYEAANAFEKFALTKNTQFGKIASRGQYFDL